MQHKPTFPPYYLSLENKLQSEGDEICEELLQPAWPAGDRERGQGEPAVPQRDQWLST